jgi:hypothetical protein
MKSTNQAGPMWEPKNRLRRPRFFGGLLDAQIGEDGQAEHAQQGEQVFDEAEPGPVAEEGIWKSAFTRPMNASTR